MIDATASECAPRTGNHREIETDDPASPQITGARLAAPARG
jgi:hypothetical protein